MTAVTDWTAHYATAAGFRHWPCEELVRWIGDRRFGAVLEVGCGNGANLWMLAEHADAVTGIDTCREALEAARVYMTRRGVSVFLDAADARRLPYRDASYDLVVDAMVSQHLPWSEHVATYTEYRRVLRPGGSVWIYHLDDLTRCAKVQLDGSGAAVDPPYVAPDYQRVSLFPDAGLTCLPSRRALVWACAEAGLRVRQSYGLGRERGDGLCAHYAVLVAEVV